MADENGKTPAPTPAEPAEAEGIPATDRVMALAGLALAILLGLIAIDLWTGGKLAALVPVRETGDDG